MNIVLMGYRCTGKTAAGRSLAKHLAFPFYDTDELVMRRTGRTIARIVADQGWPAFREAEAAVIRELSASDGAVIALGGGAILDPKNAESLKENGFFVWLFASPETIIARMAGDGGSEKGRPSLTGESIIGETKEIMAQREPLYRRLADLTVDTTDRGIEQVAEAIAAGLRERHELKKGEC